MTISIVWHTYLKPSGEARLKAVATRQAQALVSSGLLDAAHKLVVTGSDTSLSVVRSVLGVLVTEEIWRKIDCVAFEGEYHEGMTLALLDCDARESGEQSSDGYVLYLHTKGTSYLDQERISTCVDHWAMMMEFFTILRWRQCVELLSQYVSCGCEMWPHSRRSNKNKKSRLYSPVRREFWHYSGNFWWARFDYIKNLLRPPSFYETKYFSVNRMKAEDWILSSIGVETLPSDHYCLHYTGDLHQPGVIHHYLDEYLPRFYLHGGQKPVPALDPVQFNGCNDQQLDRQAAPPWAAPIRGLVRRVIRKLSSWWSQS